jgi:hypothetical protein
VIAAAITDAMLLPNDDNLIVLFELQKLAL